MICKSNICTSGGGTDMTTLKALLDGSLTEFSNSEMTSLRGYAFYYSPVKNIKMPKLTSTGAYAFGYSNIEEIELPNLNSPGNACFRSSKLKRVFLPNWKIRSNGEFFRDCPDLEFADIRNLNNLQYYIFASCPRLKTVVCSKSTLISNSAFDGCTSLTALVIEGRCSLGNVTALRNSPFASGGSGGTVYTFQENVDWYQSTANNWKDLYSGGTLTVKAIEDNLDELEELGVDVSEYNN